METFLFSICFLSENLFEIYSNLSLLDIYFVDDQETMPETMFYGLGNLEDDYGKVYTVS